MNLEKDKKSLARSAQRLVVEYKSATGCPPSFDSSWKTIWEAKADRIVLNVQSRPSAVNIWFPKLRWHEDAGVKRGDMVRLRTESGTVVFIGFITSYLSDFSGGTESKGTAFERNAITCLDHRWLLSATSPIFGQLCRGPDDYTGYGTASQEPIKGFYIHATGRRAIFNADGKPNCDPELLELDDCEVPIFTDPLRGIAWTARSMVRYILCPLNNQAYQYLPIDDPNELIGLEHTDWDKVLNHIVIDGLNVTEALHLICNNMGWGFRLDYSSAGPALVFYKINAATSESRSATNITVLHQLYAPDLGEDISVAVKAGKKILWSMSLAEDISSVVNAPLAIGSPQQFEFTAELVPAWMDSQLAPDTGGEDLDQLFFTEADLQELSGDPDFYSYYKNYHPRGSGFIRNVGRKWTLNESGRYTIPPRYAFGRPYKYGDMITDGLNIYACVFEHFSSIANQPPNKDFWKQIDGYDRGMPFDFSTVIDAKYIYDAEGKRIFAPFSRRLLPCLTVDSDSENSVGVKVEFSFNGGSTWQVIPAAISSLKDEFGIYIEEANLAELVDKDEQKIEDEESQINGVQLNYWTSLCDDKLSGRSFKNGQWKTRLRITASIQLDQRLYKKAAPTANSGSPFHHSQIYDWSEKYGLRKRTEASRFTGAVYEIDSTDYFDKHLEAVRNANEDLSVSGQFTLDRLWLGNSSGPDFAVGDCIEKITGRNYDLSSSVSETKVYPEIIQIIILPDKQKMKLITRDLRFAEVPL